MILYRSYNIIEVIITVLCSVEVHTHCTTRMNDRSHKYCMIPYGLKYLNSIIVATVITAHTFTNFIPSGQNPSTANNHQQTKLPTLPY